MANREKGKRVSCHNDAGRELGMGLDGRNTVTKRKRKRMSIIVVLFEETEENFFEKWNF